jgi:protein SCO1/2
MIRILYSALLICLLTAAPASAKEYAVRGMVVSVDRAHNTFTASIEEIPNFMRAMTMPFEVKRQSDLDGLKPGAVVEFALIVDTKTSYAERIHVVAFQNVEQDPFAASRLALLGEIVSGSSVKPVANGEAVPDFTLTDQRKNAVRLSALRGKVVALNFVYTSCALPNFCLRLANNFNVLQKRFAPRLGRDLVLLTVTFDPVHDTPRAGRICGAVAGQCGGVALPDRSAGGHSARLPDVCVHAFPNEGLMDHSLHTVVIDRQGRLVANIEGNRFTAAQLGDVVEGVLK